MKKSDCEEIKNIEAFISKKMGNGWSVKVRFECVYDKRSCLTKDGWGITYSICAFPEKWKDNDMWIHGYSKDSWENCIVDFVNNLKTKFPVCVSNTYGDFAYPVVKATPVTQEKSLAVVEKQNEQEQVKEPWWSWWPWK